MWRENFSALLWCCVWCWCCWCCWCCCWCCCCAAAVLLLWCCRAAAVLLPCCCRAAVFLYPPPPLTRSSSTLALSSAAVSLALLRAATLLFPAVLWGSATHRSLLFVFAPLCSTLCSLFDGAPPSTGVLRWRNAVRPSAPAGMAARRVLNVAEKPSIAKEIAHVLGAPNGGVTSVRRRRTRTRPSEPRAENRARRSPPGERGQAHSGPGGRSTTATLTLRTRSRAGPAR